MAIKHSSRGTRSHFTKPKRHSRKHNRKSHGPHPVHHPYTIRRDIGLEDPQGLNNNPLTGEPYKNLYINDTSVFAPEPRTYANISTTWTNKIVYGNRERLYDAIQNSQVILATAGTGVGKTVLIPRIAMHEIGRAHV